MTLDEETLEALWDKARRLLPKHGTHGSDHTERVFRMSQHLLESVGGDLSIIAPASLLHDIGRGAEDHALESAMMARGILESMEFDREQVEVIVEAISTHSFSGGRAPASLESRILSDADKLDAMGALGVYRAAMYCLEHGQPMDGFINHFHDKLLRLRDQLFTEEARRLSESRHRFMINFMVQLEKELNLRA